MDIQIITPPVADETDQLDHGLVALTEAICQVTGEESGFGLGGRFGYGEDFENDVFAMRRFYWGDCDCGYDALEERWCDAHAHADNCYQTELKAMQRAAKLPYWDGERWHNDKAHSYEAKRKIEERIYATLCAKHGKDPNFGAAVHCTCDYEPAWKAWSAEHRHKPTCSLVVPNFLHKPSGLEVRWYKWIGRGMEVTKNEGVDLQAVFAECVASLQR